MSKITRRDFINGTLMATGATMLPKLSAQMATLDQMDPAYYPPKLTGLRGSHPGSYTHAHARAWTQKSDWGNNNSSESYDLIIVGGGLSGLSAAYFYQKKHGKNKKILILDNHDDFGGHAKRNEHTIDGQLRIGYGGSQSIVEPRHASDDVNSLFKGIGVDTKRFDRTYDQKFFKRNNLGAVTYFNKEVFGEDKVVRHPFCNHPNYVQGMVMGGKLSDEQAVAETPLSAEGKKQLLAVLRGGIQKIALSDAELQEYIKKTSYYDYLKNTLGVTDPAVMRMARHTALDWSNSGADVLPIGGAKHAGAMGFKPKAVYDEEVPYIYHFPDGNAGVARAIVKKLIPNISANGRNAEQLILEKFKYNELDKSSNKVRIRLKSTVVRVTHDGDPKDADAVDVNYIKDDKSYVVKGKHVIMACYNMIIPHIVSGLPEEQHAALRQQTKCPLIYTSVGVKNWKAMKEMEIGLALSPGNMHQCVMMDFPVSMGGYEYSKTPNDPCIIQMISCPYGEIPGTPARDQYKEARRRMLGLQFSDYEKEIRSHLSGMLPKSSFNFDRDVESITVNRWAHGYTVSGPEGSVAIGRQPFGRIRIANCDSAAKADAKAAIDMAARAVNELS